MPRVIGAALFGLACFLFAVAVALVGVWGFIGDGREPPHPVDESASRPASASPSSPPVGPSAQASPRLEVSPPASCGPAVDLVLSCTFTFRNTGDVIADGRFIFPRPESHRPWCEVLQVAFTPSHAVEGTDPAGNPQVSIDVKGVSPGQTRRAVMRVRARLRPLVLDVDARAAGTHAPLPAEARACLAATSDLPADDPEVRRAAAAIAGDESNRWYVLVALFDHVRGLTFDEHHRVGDVRQAIRTGRVQCADAAALLATLARAAGIPARVAGGIFAADEASSTRDTHAWVEAWVPSLGWVPLDPTMARFDDAARASRLAALMKGYVPLWSRTWTPFMGLVTGPAGARADAAMFNVSFSWRVEPGDGASSLLDVFPVPRAPAESQTASPAPAWLRLAAEETAGRAGARSREEATLTAAAAQAPTVDSEVALAAFYLRTRQLGRALAALQDAIVRDPAAPAPWRTLVSAYGALEIWDGVALSAERAQAASPGGASPLYGEMAMIAGQAYLRMGDPTRARDAFRDALRTAPNDGWLHAMLGWALRDCGDRAQARVELSRGLALGIRGGERSFFERMRNDLSH